jgi:glycine/D-amino acid oxidase-like deaminating enzyme
MSSLSIDTLIIGQGLAGSALAWHLAAAGQRVHVIDDGHRTSSSVVAAGLVNPLAGMRFNRRPEVLDWLNCAEDWYADIGRQFERQFYFALPMLRLFRSMQQRRFHDRASSDPDNATLLDDRPTRPGDFTGLQAEFGGFLQRRTGYLDMCGLLDAMRNWLQSGNRFQYGECSAHAVEVHADRIVLGSVQAGQVVFCDGARLRDNPWFDSLPLSPEKGEILDLRIPDGDHDRIVNGQYWLVPRIGGGFRFGATHEHQHIDNQPTQTGRNQLMHGMQDMLTSTDGVAVENHLAGIRPGTTDRYPLIGRHAAHPRIIVFNGFGARGALSIPWYAKRLTRHLVEDAALPPEADIARFG